MPAHRSRRILRLRVSLVGIEPEIWRTVDVDDSLTLAELHTVLQVVFNWFDSHLHRFSDDDPWVKSNGIPRIGRQPRAWVDAWSLTELDLEGEEDEAGTTIGEAMQHDGPLWYVYDQGDNWLHRIDLVDRDVASTDEPPAQLVPGERRAPFENSGGCTGFEELASILADPSHPGFGSTKAWVGTAVGPWGTDDLEDADPDGARAELALLFGPARDDLSGLADAATGVTADSPLAQFAASLPVPLRSNLRRHLRRAGLLASVPIRDEDVADAVKPYAWLIDRIGVDGLTLTKAGWMPPAVVLEGMTALGWRDEWIGEANREDLTYPMRGLRASAERLRLIRKAKGRLEVVSRTRPAIGRPAVLAEQIGRMLLRQRMTDGQRVAATVLAIGLADGSIATRRDAERRVIGVLNELGYVDAQGRELELRWFSSLTESAVDVLEALGLWRAGGRRRDVPATDAVRAIARIALR
ncbi:plasmid pRiA4b ORF-3 family protein [Microbacterium sp. zg.Y1084]|uniref:plasmid pRiA4b ORF-3 family protein n=1 Tax=Microbacterium sp. zg.Y1084 TaxID=2969667 RepID=UPI00214C3BFD|nr:plasmid pRiA4b ORF-3 family protein [Microbacterium sp. zg.Y1084]MCR2812896.1 plasmid pRiA4b ORF-3 family protein [Microbacterium sp. zg.Y1084]